jgi:16S rRNA C1402 (ribose-2'-O) methylase RsmI
MPALYLSGYPIGNLEDIAACYSRSERSKNIAAEDARKPANYCPPMTSKRNYQLPRA